MDLSKLFKEYLEILQNDPLSLPVWWMLQMKFMLPAMMIARKDSLEKFVSSVSLNGIKSNICKPY